MATEGTKAEIIESTAPGRAAELSKQLKLDDESSPSIVCAL